MNAAANTSDESAARPTVVSELRSPLIIEHGGQPVAVVLPYEEFRKLEVLRSDEEQRVKLGWAGIDRLLAEIHQRQTGIAPEQIEAEITAARSETKQVRHADRSRT